MTNCDMGQGASKNPEFYMAQFMNNSQWKFVIWTYFNRKQRKEGEANLGKLKQYEDMK